MLDKIFPPGLDLLAFVLPVSIAVTNIVFFPLAALWLFGARWTWPRWPPVWGWPEKLFLLYLGTSLASALVGLEPIHSVKEIKNKDFYILIAIVLVALVKDRAQVERLLKIFLAASLLMAVWGLLQYAIGVNIYEKSDPHFVTLPAALAHWPRPILNLLSMANGRVEGTRGHPLAYAECLLFSWSFGISYFLVSRGREGLKWIGYLALTGGGLLVSQSRGPWIAAGLIVVLAVLTSPTRAGRGILFGLCAFFIILFASVPILRHRVQSILDNKQQSNYERVHMWRAGWQIWKSHPILGIGPGSVKAISVSFQTPEEKVFGAWGHLHSTYINALVERGVLGLATLLLFFGALKWEIWQAFRKSSGDLPKVALYHGSLLGLAGFFISGLTETTYNTAVVMMTFYFVAGLALALSRHEPIR